MTVYKITGNTYAARTELRNEGAVWDAKAKCWYIKIIDKGMKRNDGALIRLRGLGLTFEPTRRTSTRGAK